MGRGQRSEITLFSTAFGCFVPRFWPYVMRNDDLSALSHPPFNRSHLGAFGLS